MNKRTRRIVIFVSLLVFILAWTALLYVVSPRSLVSAIGVKNTYLTIFLVASIGGFSSFTGYPLLTLMATFVAGGSHPLLIGLCSGSGVMIGDSLFFLFGVRGRKAMSDKTRHHVDRLTQWISKRHRYVVPFFMYVYAAILPLPNDIMTVAVSLTGYPYRKAIIPLYLGNLTHMTLISYLAFFGMQFTQLI